MAKKILLVSCSAGAGHTRSAAAVEQYGRDHYPQISFQHIDLLDYITPASKKAYFDWYNFVVKYIPCLWDWFYTITDNRRGANAFNWLTAWHKKHSTARLSRLIADLHPHYIIASHFTAADVLANYLDKPAECGLGVVITDYYPHALWASQNIDHFFVANSEVGKQLENFDINRGKIAVSGIPAGAEFYSNHDVGAIRAKYKIDQNKKTILLLAGGDGLIRIDEIVHQLCEHYHGQYNLIAVAGKNTILLNKLQTLTIKYPNIKAFGWTEQMVELMAIADVVISKPGGMTVTECAAMNKPLIIIDPIPGQEEYNAQYVEANGLGTWVKNSDEMFAAITKYFNQPFSTKIKSAGNPAEMIIQTIVNSSKSPTT